MKIILVPLLLIVSIACESQKHNNSLPATSNELAWLGTWLNAWELVSDSTLKLPRGEVPAMLFYDHEFVYTTSEVSAPEGVKIEGPLYFSQPLTWLKQAHNDTLTLPDREKVPIQLMSFAAPFEDKNATSYFVMAAPSYWLSSGIQNEIVGLDKMLTGIFLHEFTHTRQMDAIAAKIIAFAETQDFDFDVNDDIIQNYFSPDTVYTDKFKAETELFYKAAQAASIHEVKALTNQALALLHTRQETLSGVGEIFVDMDRVFLSMEGIGQYVTVKWLMHPLGGNVAEETAIRSTRRNKKWWSQDEGLALALVYEKLSNNPDWSFMFDEAPSDIVSMIELELQ